VALIAAVGASITQRHHNINIGTSITRWKRKRDTGCTMLHVYAIYESMQMQQHATIKAHVCKTIRIFLIYLALGVAQKIQQQDLTLYIPIARI